MHTANVSTLRSAIEEYYRGDDSDWLAVDFDLVSKRRLDPHILEHEARAAELSEDTDDDAAMIHQLLGQNMRRAAQSTN